MKVQIKMADGREGFLPKKAKGDVGWDLMTSSDVTISHGELVKIPLAIIVDLGGVHAIVKEKSSLAAQGVEVHGGVMDRSFRKEWQLILRYLKPASYYPEKVTFARGVKVAQFILFAEYEVNISQVPEVEDTWNRGSFGSTGSF